MNNIIYQIFVRNYSKEGTFKAITKDLIRIKELGVDIIYLMPINEIGIKERKGTWGSPYASKDYFSISSDLGTLDDLHELIDETHKQGMKIIIDMVFNHTSPDNPLLKEHPEYYFYRNGKPANKIGDWSDIIDLENTKEETQQYLLSVIRYWRDQGFDGFRFDVASIIPFAILKGTRDIIGPDGYMLAESVNPEFLIYCKGLGLETSDDFKIATVFTLQYNYNYYHALEKYLQGTKPLKELIDILNAKENTLPRITGFENHDRERIYALAKTKKRFKELIKLEYILKGTPFIYAGQETGTKHKPELFEKDPIDWSKCDKEIYNLFKENNALKHKEKEIKNQSFELIDEHSFKINTTYVDETKKIDIIKL